jgi:uncharacterized protein YggE
VACLIRPKNLLATLLLAVACLSGRHAVADEPAPAQLSGHTITAVGKGMVSAAVDTAQLTVAVTAEGSLAQDAMDAQRVKLKRLVEMLHAAGVADGAISVAPAQLTARFAPPAPFAALGVPPIAVQSQPVTNTGAPAPTPPARPVVPAPPKRDGFRTSTTVTIKTHDLSNLGILTDHIADNADNQAPTMAFIIDDPEKFIDEARQKAFDNAEHIARLEAERAHLKLGQVRSVRDAPPPTPFTDFGDRANAAAANSNQGMMFITLKGPQSISVAIEVQWDAEP